MDPNQTLSAEASRRQQELLSEKTKDFDVVITTALVPGKPAPRLVTKETVAGMPVTWKAPLLVSIPPRPLVVRFDTTVTSVFQMHARPPVHVRFVTVQAVQLGILYWPPERPFVTSRPRSDR